MHILGLGDFPIKSIESIDDPCPVLLNKRAKDDAQKEELIKKKRTLK